MRRTVYLIGLCLVLTIGLYGCGSSSTADSGQAATTAKSAKVNFNVTFPAKSAVKSLIPQGTAYVYLYWAVYDMTSGSSAWGDLTLYPDANNTAKATAEMIPGFYVIYADCYDANGSLLSSAYNYAQVGEGSNDILITFVQGRWTFVDSAGTAAPITLSSFSGGKILSSFDISSYGSEYYPINWNLSDSTALKGSYLMYRSFSGDASQLALYASALGIPSNLLSGTVQIDAIDTAYNLTDPTRSNRGYELEGDRLFMFASVDPGIMQAQYYSSLSTYSPDVSQYFNTQIASGTKLTGTIIEYTVGPATTPIDTGKACTPIYNMPKAPKLANKLSTLASKSSLLGTVTETHTECLPNATYTAYTEYQYQQTYTDVYYYPFAAAGTDLPTGVLFKK